MPAAERHYYDQHKFNPSKSSQHELEHNLMLQSQKRYFPSLQGRGVPTSSVPTLLCYTGFTNRMYKCMQVELQNLICWLLFLLFPGGTKGQMKSGQGPGKGLAAEKIS